MTDEISREDYSISEAVLMPMCPMGETCKRMMENPPSRFLMYLPGLVFVAVGILIVVEPGILVWLIATASILAGIAMMGCAYFMSMMGMRVRRGKYREIEREDQRG